MQAYSVEGKCKINNNMVCDAVNSLATSLGCCHATCPDTFAQSDVQARSIQAR